MKRFDWDAEAQKDAALATVLLLKHVGGEEFANCWAWNKTPMPIGRPTWRQLWDGLMSFKPHKKTIRRSGAAR